MTCRCCRCNVLGMVRSSMRQEVVSLGSKLPKEDAGTGDGWREFHTISALISFSSPHPTLPHPPLQLLQLVPSSRLLFLQLPLSCRLGHRLVTASLAPHPNEVSRSRSPLDRLSKDSTTTLCLLTCQNVPTHHSDLQHHARRSSHQMRRHLPSGSVQVHAHRHRLSWRGNGDR